MHIDCRRDRNVLPTCFSVQGGLIKPLKDGEAYGHLGIPTGFWRAGTLREEADNICKDINKIDASLLSPWQKLDGLRTFVIPRIDFILRGSSAEKKNSPVLTPS